MNKELEVSVPYNAIGIDGILEVEDSLGNTVELSLTMVGILPKSIGRVFRVTAPNGEFFFVGGLDIIDDEPKKQNARRLKLMEFELKAWRERNEDLHQPEVSLN